MAPAGIGIRVLQAVPGCDNAVMQSRRYRRTKLRSVKAMASQQSRSGAAETKAMSGALADYYELLGVRILSFATFIFCALIEKDNEPSPNRSRR